jgi:hypothetical protein
MARQSAKRNGTHRTCNHVNDRHAIAIPGSNKNYTFLLQSVLRPRICQFTRRVSQLYAFGGTAAPIGGSQTMHQRPQCIALSIITAVMMICTWKPSRIWDGPVTGTSTALSLAGKRSQHAEPCHQVSQSVHRACNNGHSAQVGKEHFVFCSIWWKAIDSAWILYPQLLCSEYRVITQGLWRKKTCSDDDRT